MSYENFEHCMTNYRVLFLKRNNIFKCILMYHMCWICLKINFFKWLLFLSSNTYTVFKITEPNQLKILHAREKGFKNLYNNSSLRCYRNAISMILPFFKPLTRIDRIFSFYFQETPFFPIGEMKNVKEKYNKMVKVSEH